LGRGGIFLRKARAKFSDRPTGFIWIEQDRVAASGYPASRRQLEWVSRQGVNTVLTLTEDSLPDGVTRGLALSFKHIPMKDHEPPNIEDLEKAAAFVLTEVRQGRKVLVHCLAGQGRTMCVVAAYLIKDRGMKPEEAMRMLRSVRRNAIETAQVEAIFDYAEQPTGGTP
jgi:atypical dual specificity phosphatase